MAKSATWPRGPSFQWKNKLCRAQSELTVNREPDNLNSNYFSKVPIAKGYTLFMFIIYIDYEIFTGLLGKGEIT